MATILRDGCSVSVPATFFDIAGTPDEDKWSVATFGDDWQSARCCGTVQKVTLPSLILACFAEFCVDPLALKCVKFCLDVRIFALLSTVSQDEKWQMLNNHQNTGLSSSRHKLWPSA